MKCIDSVWLSNLDSFLKYNSLWDSFQTCLQQDQEQVGVDLGRDGGCLGEGEAREVGARQAQEKSGIRSQGAFTLRF